MDHFDGAGLDREVWLPHYLPHWSSRAESAATYAVSASELRLTIPLDQPLWCAGVHEPPLRVSGVQSGVLDGQQPFRDGLEVREHQETWWGWTPLYGRIEVRARMSLSPRSMASVWMAGVEDAPERSGEICLFEVFGDAPAAIGMGIKHFRDPALHWEFETHELPIDVADLHVYAADWRPGAVDFSVDGAHVVSVAQAPAYPLQMMIGVFDFPQKAPSLEHVPEFALDYVRC
jgi:hypothetical protein